MKRRHLEWWLQDILIVYIIGMIANYFNPTYGGSQIIYSQPYHLNALLTAVIVVPVVRLAVKLSAKKKKG